MYIISVNKYKYSQESRRRILKKLAKDGFIKFIGLINKNYTYSIPNEESMLEYRKRTGKIKVNNVRRK